MTRMRWGMLLLMAATAGCGRLGFDRDGAGGDGLGSDGMLGDGPLAVSCGTLAPTCGPTQSSPCCESPVVTGGTYFRSYDGVGYNDMGYPATVSNFWLDKYEVTVERFRQFVNAGFGTQQKPPGMDAGARMLNGSANQGGWDTAWNTTSLAADTTALIAAVKCDATYQTWTDTPGGNENRSMNCIDWYEAMAFCIWDGGFLPTEAEWNYAASGGSLQRAYPWSSPPTDTSTINGTIASYDDGTDCVGDGMAGCALTDLVPVGTKPGVWGQSDLGGNVWEWTLDWYNATYPTPCNDCANLTPATSRVQRGGSFNYIAPFLRVGYRLSGGATTRNYRVGFRCAR